MGFVSTPAALFLKYTVSRMNCSFLLFPHSCTRELINDAVVSCNFTRGPVVVIYFWILSFQGFVAVNCIVFFILFQPFFYALWNYPYILRVIWPYWYYTKCSYTFFFYFSFMLLQPRVLTFLFCCFYCSGHLVCDHFYLFGAVFVPI